MAQGDPPEHNIEETKNQQIDYLVRKVKFNQNILLFNHDSLGPDSLSYEL